MNERKPNQFQPGQYGKIDKEINLMPIEDTQFKVGNPGGPGRPKGSKNRLSEYFLFELADHFEKYGREAIVRVCEDSPGEYLRIIASLIPKELILEQTQEETVRWVINASSKALTEAQWREIHGLDRPEHRFIESDDS
jgi:hypothetical protein